MRTFIGLLLIVVKVISIERATIDANDQYDIPILAFSICDKNLLLNFSDEVLILLHTQLMKAPITFKEMTELALAMRTKNLDLLAYVQLQLKNAALEKVPGYFVTSKLLIIFKRVFALVKKSELFESPPVFTDDPENDSDPAKANFKRRISHFKELAEKQDITKKLLQVTFDQLVEGRASTKIPLTVSFFERNMLQIVLPLYVVLDERNLNNKLTEDEMIFLRDFFDIFINYPETQKLLEAILNYPLYPYRIDPAQKGNFLESDYFNLVENEFKIYYFMLLDKAILFGNTDFSLNFRVIQAAKKNRYSMDNDIFSFIDDPKKELMAHFSFSNYNPIQKTMGNFYYLVTHLRSNNILNSITASISGYIVRQFLMQTKCYDTTRVYVRLLAQNSNQPAIMQNYQNNYPAQGKINIQTGPTIMNPQVYGNQTPINQNMGKPQVNNVPQNYGVPTNNYPNQNNVQFNYQSPNLQNQPMNDPYKNNPYVNPVQNSPVQYNQQVGKQGVVQQTPQYQINPQQYTPQQYTPQQYTPQQYTPQQYTPQQYTPQQYTPQQYTPQQYTPQQYNPQTNKGQILGQPNLQNQELNKAQVLSPQQNYNSPYNNPINNVQVQQNVQYNNLNKQQGNNIPITGNYPYTQPQGLVQQKPMEQDYYKQQGVNQVNNYDKSPQIYNQVNVEMNQQKGVIQQGPQNQDLYKGNGLISPQNQNVQYQQVQNSPQNNPNTSNLQVNKQPGQGQQNIQIQDMKKAQVLSPQQNMPNQNNLQINKQPGIYQQNPVNIDMSKAQVLNSPQNFQNQNNLGGNKQGVIQQNEPKNQGRVESKDQIQLVNNPSSKDQERVENVKKGSPVNQIQDQNTAKNQNVGGQNTNQPITQNNPTNLLNNQNVVQNGAKVQSSTQQTGFNWVDSSLEKTPSTTTLMMPNYLQSMGKKSFATEWTHPQLDVKKYTHVLLKKDQLPMNNFGQRYRFQLFNSDFEFEKYLHEETKYKDYVKQPNGKYILKDVNTPSVRPIESANCEIDEFVGNFGKYFPMFWKFTMLMDGASTPSESEQFIIKNRPFFTLNFNPKYAMAVPEIGNDILIYLSSNAFYKVNKEALTALELVNDSKPVTIEKFMKAKEQVSKHFRQLLELYIFSKKGDEILREIDLLISNISKANLYVGLIFYDICYAYVFDKKDDPAAMRLLAAMNKKIITSIQAKVEKFKMNGFALYIKHTLYRPDYNLRTNYYSFQPANELRYFDLYFFFFPQLKGDDLKRYLQDLFAFEYMVPVTCADTQKNPNKCLNAQIEDMTTSQYVYTRNSGVAFFMKFLNLFDLYDHVPSNSAQREEKHNRNLLDLFNSIYSFFANIRYRMYIPVKDGFEMVWANLEFCTVQLDDSDPKYYKNVIQLMQKKKNLKPSDLKNIEKLEHYPEKIESRCVLSMRKYNEIFYFIFFFIYSKYPAIIAKYNKMMEFRVEYRLDTFLRYLALEGNALLREVEGFCNLYENEKICFAIRIFANTVDFLKFKSIQFDIYYDKFLSPELENISKMIFDKNKFRAILWNVFFALSKFEKQNGRDQFFRLLDQGRINYNVAVKSGLSSPYGKLFDLLEINEVPGTTEYQSAIVFLGKFLKGRYSTRPTVLLESNLKTAVEYIWDKKDLRQFKYKGSALLTEILEFMAKYTSKGEHYLQMAQLLIEEKRVLDIVHWTTKNTNPFEDVVTNKFLENPNDKVYGRVLEKAFGEYMAIIEEKIGNMKKRDAEELKNSSSNNSPPGRELGRRKTVIKLPNFDPKNLQNSQIFGSVNSNPPAEDDNFFPTDALKKSTPGALSFEVEMRKIEISNSKKVTLTDVYLKKLELLTMNPAVKSVTNFLSRKVLMNSMAMIKAKKLDVPQKGSQNMDFLSLLSMRSKVGKI